MDGIKGFLASKTIWGAVVALLGTLGTLLGFDFGAADQATLLDSVYQVMEIGGILFAMYGRVVGSKKIG